MRWSVHGSAGVLLNEQLTGAHPRPLCRPPYLIVCLWPRASSSAAPLLLAAIADAGAPPRPTPLCQVAQTCAPYPQPSSWLMVLVPVPAW
jgi:hypothetical protein